MAGTVAVDGVSIRRCSTSAEACGREGPAIKKDGISIVAVPGVRDREACNLTKQSGRKRYPLRSISAAYGIHPVSSGDIRGRF